MKQTKFRHRTPDERATAVARVAAGESVRSVAGAMAVTPAAVRKWIAASRAASSSSSSSSPASSEPPAGLLEALAAIGATPPSSAAVESSSSPASETPIMPSSSSSPLAPSGPIGPDALVAFAAMLNGMCVRMACSSARYVPSSDELERLVAFTSEERAILTFLAPFAAAKSGNALARLEPLLPWAFVGAAGFFAYSRARAVQELAKLARSSSSSSASSSSQPDIRSSDRGRDLESTPPAAPAPAPSSRSSSSIFSAVAS